MGNMTLAAADIRKVYSVGDRKQAEVLLAFSNSYATGGDSVVATNLGMELEIDAIEVQATQLAGVIDLTAVAVWDHVNSRIALFTTFPGTQATNASDNSTRKVFCVVTFRGYMGAVNS